MIKKDRNYDGVAKLPSAAHKRQVSFMKRAPGRHEADALTVGSQLAPGRHHSRNAIDYLHSLSEVSRAVSDRH